MDRKKEMIEFEILNSGLYRSDQVVVRYDPTQHLTVSAETRAEMNAFWLEKLAQAKRKGTRLYDAPLFRLVEARTDEDGILRVLAGNTSYKEYVTTREPWFSAGKARAELGNPLSVCSVVETSDGYILLDRRQGVDVYEGRYHVIGGFFECEMDMGAQGPDPFAAMRREIREETGIQEADIREQFCLGIVYDFVTPHPEIVFLTRLGITLDQVRTRIPEDDEVVVLETLQVTEASLRDFLLRQHGNISATGEPNLLLYGQWKFGQKWFEDVLARIK
jgi:8-oxo-dGTP pyrophosphatase MutT (NUDIX family)